MKKSGVYCFLNLRTRKVYIGSSINVDSRRKSHIYCLKKNKHINKYFQRAWNKEGEEGFLFFVLCWCSENILIKNEAYWIDKFKAYDSNYGYNNMIAEGERISHSVETRKKFSKIDRSGFFKSVIQYNKTGQLIKIWPSLKEASLNLNISPDRISHSIRNGYKANGYLWKHYTSDYEEQISVKKCLKGKANGKPIVAIKGSEVIEFESFTQAIAFIGEKSDFFRVKIKKCCDGELTSFRGFQWKYK